MSCRRSGRRLTRSAISASVSTPDIANAKLGTALLKSYSGEFLAPTPEAIAAVVGVLEANAEFSGTREDVFLRVARGP